MTHGLVAWKRRTTVSAQPWRTALEWPTPRELMQVLTATHPPNCQRNCPTVDAAVCPMCAPERYDHDQDARNAPRATRWCALRSVHNLDSVPVSLPTTQCEATDACPVQAWTVTTSTPRASPETDRGVRRSWIAGLRDLARASVGLTAGALVWILPNLSFATAVPPLTGARHV